MADERENPGYYQERHIAVALHRTFSGERIAINPLRADNGKEFADVIAVLDKHLLIVQAKDSPNTEASPTRVKHHRHGKPRFAANWMRGFELFHGEMAPRQRENASGLVRAPSTARWLARIASRNNGYVVGCGAEMLLARACSRCEGRGMHRSCVGSLADGPCAIEALLASRRLTMSALVRIPDSSRTSREVRKVPRTDIGSRGCMRCRMIPSKSIGSEDQ